MSRYFFSCLLLLICSAVYAQPADSVSNTRKPESTQHQLRFGVDISRPVLHAFFSERTSYEFMLDYYLRNEIYLVGEGGFGNAGIDYDDLKYTTENTFFRLGIDKSMFPRQQEKDWGMAFIGVRYGVGFISRSEAFYKTDDGLGGVTSGLIPAQNLTAHWFEITGGMRLELIRNFFAGWNVRGRFLLNQNQFRELQPAYIAGYGKGDKNAIFDFNFYLSYAIRWSRSNSKETTKKQ